MQAKILITNNTGDNHSADTWAMAAAEMLADTTGLDVTRQIEGRKLQLKFSEVLAEHFGACSVMEQDKLKNDPKHVISDHHSHVEIAGIVAELEAAAKGTAWEYHYQLPEVQAALTQELTHLLHSSVHLDRMLHVDRNPDCEHAQAYRAKFGV